jgi:hypothetical protein
MLGYEGAVVYSCTAMSMKGPSPDLMLEEV